MIRRPPRSTLPDTLCPYTLRCRSEPALNGGNPGPQEGLSFPQRLQGPGVDPQPSGRLQAAGDPALARRARLDGGEEPGAAGAFLDRPQGVQAAAVGDRHAAAGGGGDPACRSEEHTSELQSLMRI